MRGPAGGEAGFTLIEVLIAAVILALASLAVFGVLAAATRNAQRATATQVALDAAQEEMEKLHSLSYSELALTTPPETSSNLDDPNYRYKPASRTFYLQREPMAEPATIVREGGEIWGKEEETIDEAAVIPGPVPFESGNVKGKLYRYVVWRNDPTCPESEAEGGEDFCPGPQDYKQIIVAAKIDKSSSQTAETSYVEVQSQVANPEAHAQRSTQGEETEKGYGGTGEGSQAEQEEREKEEAEDETEGLGSGKAVTAQQFFLSDTACAEDGETVRQPIEGDHLLHNTLGTCASGLRNGSSRPGAPDALLLGAPPDPDPVDETNPPLYDYSSDSYLEPNPDTDKGVQILPDDTSGCHAVPTSTVDPEAKIHRWVSDPMPKPFKMNGVVSLEFFSRTLNEASYPATVCVFVFEREEEGSGEATVAHDTYLTNAVTGNEYWTFSSQGNESWPRTGWTKLRLTMNFAARTVLENHRLGVALSVDPANTPPDVAIPIMYDHPNYPSRLEVDTTTPLEWESPTAPEGEVPEGESSGSGG
jgi:prepilin-type N-terminal cleavage/methylation domain-containing protein